MIDTKNLRRQANEAIDTSVAVKNLLDEHAKLIDVLKSGRKMSAAYNLGPIDYLQASHDHLISIEACADIKAE